jgi:hypothetical protein
LTRTPFFCQLLGQRLGEDHDGALGHGVVDDIFPGRVGVDRRGVDDGRAWTEVAQGRLGNSEHGVDVGFECLVELFVR